VWQLNGVIKRATAPRPHGRARIYGQRRTGRWVAPAGCVLGLGGCWCRQVGRRRRMAAGGVG
jgi:hypothetical protein